MKFGRIVLSGKCSSTDRVVFMMRRYTFKMAVMTTLQRRADIANAVAYAAASARHPPQRVGLALGGWWYRACSLQFV